MADDLIFFGLLTHSKSQYFVNSKHDNFNLVTKSYGANSCQIHSVNLYDEKDISRIQVFSQIFDIFILLKNMLRTRSIVVKYSGSFFFLFKLEQIKLIIFDFLTLIVSLFFAVFNQKIYNDFRRNLIRQSNISAGHINLTKQSLRSGKKYVLVLEDDFLIEDMKSVNEMLKFVTNTDISSSKLQIINLSKSFSHQELGFRNFVKDTVVNTSFPNQSIDVLKYPVTNTVCATLYKINFLIKLTSELESQKQISIIPIDHKINIALNKLIRKGLIDKECYGSSNPSLFIQGSLHG
jgi:hypothetical protein